MKKIRQILKALTFSLPLCAKTGLLRAQPSVYPYLKIEPSSATIMLTDRCNLKCIMCKQWRKPAADELSTDDWKGIIKDLKANGIRNIHFTGGEPLLRKDLRELVAYSRKNGMVTGITTNGILLTGDVLKGLLDAGIRSIAVSLDATGTAYDDIRGIPHLFERIRESITLVGVMRKSAAIDAYINFTLMKNNMEELKKVKSMADEAGLPVHICLLDRSSFIFKVEENKSRFWIESDDDRGRLRAVLDFVRHEKITNPRTLITNFPAIDFIEEYFKDPRQARIPCVSSQNRIIIDPYGNLLGGCMSMGAFGNLKEKPFRVLLSDKRYMTARKDMFYKKCKGCSCGYFFNIQYTPDLVMKDLGARVKNLLRRKA
ncbi:MAG: radical SAM protein [Candidatus Omnitrophica bacterium]|nr:radical SAM protein [Candidatus Omnitrophota bacterium]